MQVGFRHVDQNGGVINAWGGVWGECPPCPDVVRLLSGAFVYAPSVGEVFIDGSRLEAWTMDSAPLRLPSALDVEAERERRLAGGFLYDFGDARGVHNIGTTAADMVGWDDVTKVSGAAIALGNPGATLTIVTNTAPVQITALDWQRILIAAGTFRQPIWAGSFRLQAMTPIPADYAADKYWV